MGTEGKRSGTRSEGATTPAPDDAAQAPVSAPDPPAPKASAEPTFGLDRLRGREGPHIVASSFEGSNVPAGATAVGAIAGALEGLDEDAELTRSQIRSRIEGFLRHRDDTYEEG